MSIPALLFSSYVIIGAEVAAAIALSNFSNRRSSIAALVGDIAGFHVIGFLIFLVLWPIWLALLLFAGRGEDRIRSAEEVPVPEARPKINKSRTHDC